MIASDTAPAAKLANPSTTALLRPGQGQSGPTAPEAIKNNSDLALGGEIKQLITLAITRVTNPD
jgi:hypothetical protein